MDRNHRRSLGHIDELLTMMFSYLDDRDLARAACVCKHWAELALDALWSEVNDLRRVLTVLAPLAFKTERVPASTARIPGAYVFKRPLVPADWQRFQRYSGRVRSLRHDQRHARNAMEKSKRPTLLHPKVFADLTTTCPTDDIFPNLQSLVWYACAPERQRLCLAFVHRRVKHLGLHLYRSEPSSLTDYVRQVCARCKDLTVLDLSLAGPMRQLEEEVSILIRGFPRLRKISLPIYCLTSRLFNELSILQQLDTISLGDPARAEPGDRADVTHLVPAFSNDAFPVLRSLSFSAQVADATHSIRSSLFPAHLTELHLKSVVIATPEALRELFIAIRDRCTSLVELSVDYIIAPDSPLLSPPPPLSERPSLECFRPLFSARSLRAFELRWDYALNLADNDIDELASSWPSLESLQLNAEPVPEANGPCLTLRSLLPFARNCPNLRHLGLHVDATTVPSFHQHPHSQDLPRFRCLQTFAVGLSAIARAETVTLFLSQILPLDCSVCCGLRWPDAFDIAMEHALIPVSLRAEMSACWVRWIEVSKLLPITTKARMEEKARIEGLEKQMAVLEMSRREDRQRLSSLEREVQDLRGRTGRTP
ncbi:hypothetical protein DICSQDRAFT_58994 [Dichomitus squalens LYAD-421 SS1]|uniref:F-box domain-containing protein n=1 Tax=Dichomitus squalens (strain LYAD-421) TaxID=732165 RepID=R7T0S6_DICSQ|nr:uncharacterized protein DICSQDRAFT_58994 [Dichomitus squalens LYAD-421 SS1]EJF61956.1 hypothetical protein DICSQDRAFT_58994 [Dichomitus squalens LYAD-421 SS1]